jgi:predicted transcriptional regulator
LPSRVIQRNIPYYEFSPHHQLALDRDRSYLLNEAVETYLSEQRRFVALVEEGLGASRKGRLIDHEEVGAMIDSWVRKKAKRKKH